MRLLRSIHRWLSIVVALFFILLAGTGLGLQFQPDLGEHIGPSRLSDAQIEAGFARALATVRATHPDARIGLVLMNVSIDAPSITIGLMARPKPGEADATPGIPGGPGDSLVIDPRSGRIVHPKDNLHGILLQIHSNLLLGPPGRWLFMTVGFVLLYLTLSGLVFYGDMLRLRIKRGLPAPFWQVPTSSGLGRAGVLWNIHRWVAPIAGFFLLVIAVSGIMMHSGPTGLDLWGGKIGLAGAALAPVPVVVPPDMTDRQLEQVLATGLALGSQQDAHPERLMNLDFNGNGPSTHIALTYHSDSQGMYSRIWDARSWESRKQLAPFKLFFFFLRLHRGDLFHTTGTVLNIATGIGLLLLSLSGLVMYSVMLGRRLARGARGLFWK